MTNLNASRRDLRKRQTDDVEVEGETACAVLVVNSSIPSKRRTVHPRGLAVVNENVEEQTFEALAHEYDARVSTWGTLRCTSCSAGVYSDVRPR
jgi:N-dimethylarginine dimethylaminohydrolase